jgi:hypothetical protein
MAGYLKIEYRMVSHRADWGHVLYAGTDGSIIAVQLRCRRKNRCRPALSEFQWHQLRQYRDRRTGYWKVSLQDVQKGFQLEPVHRLVCETWALTPRDLEGGKLKACHRNNDKDDNSESNLYWGNDPDQSKDGQERIDKFLRDEHIILQVRCTPVGLEGKLYREGGGPVKIFVSGWQSRSVAG